MAGAWRRTVGTTVDGELAGDSLVLEVPTGRYEVVKGRLPFVLGRCLVPRVAVLSSTSDAGDGKDPVEGLNEGREEGLPLGF